MFSYLFPSLPDFVLRADDSLPHKVETQHLSAQVVAAHHESKSEEKKSFEKRSMNLMNMKTVRVRKVA